MALRRYPDTSDVQASALKSTFIADGVTCAATLFVPQEAEALKQPLPAILMVGGWGGVQEALTSSFVHRFVAAGYAVMEFDYPGWGLSGGWPRQDINPWRRVKTANAALAHLKSHPLVNARHLILWGTSFGGGHVVELAAQHPDLQGAIIQVPMLDGLAAVKAVPVLQSLKFFSYAVADLLKPGAPIHIPTVAPKGEFGSMDRDEAWNAIELGLAAHQGKKYDNRVTARSVLTMGFYRPCTQLKHIKIPMLVLGATRDTVAPFVPDTIRRANNPLIEVIEMDVDHFDPYFDPYFPDTIRPQLAFLRRLSHQAA